MVLEHLGWYIPWARNRRLDLDCHGCERQTKKAWEGERLGGAILEIRWARDEKVVKEDDV